jgi:arylsulfatase A-like enzyme
MKSSNACFINRASKQFGNKSDAGAYADGIEEMDWVTGQVLASIEPVKNNTLVIWTADNGPWCDSIYNTYTNET